MNSLLTVKDLRSMLHVHPNTVYKLIDHQEIPFIKKKGVGIRFRREEIEEWLKQGSSKIYPLLESFSKIDLALDKYDKLYLKGGRVSQKGKSWNYPFGSVYLRQTKSGQKRWYIYYRVDKRRIRKVVKNAQSRADALKVLQIEVADIFRGKYGFKRDKKKIRFKELADLYLENFNSKKSWREDKYRTDAHLKPYFGKKELDDITPLLIHKYRTRRLNAGAQQSTTNRELALLKTMYFKAIDWGYAHSNPVRKVKFFSEKDKLKERILTEEEESRLLEACPEELKPIILTALHTGMRRKEILNLQWKDVDLEKRHIKVIETKSGRNRIIPINTVMLNELWKLKQNSQAYVFPFRHPRSVRTAFENSREKALLTDLRFHDMRHTFATRLVERGVDLITVQELLGHHSVVVTQRYTHSNAEQKRRAVGVLSKSCPQIVHKKPVHPDVPLASNYFSVN